MQVLCRTKYVAYHPDQFERAQIADTVENLVCILAGNQHAFVAQYRQVLRDVALRCADLFHNILHTDLLVAQYAQYLQAQRVRDRLDCMCCLEYIFFPVYESACHFDSLISSVQLHQGR